MDIEVVGRQGAVGSAVVAALRELSAVDRAVRPVRVFATPADVWREPGPTHGAPVTIGPAIGRAQAEGLDVADAGWFGGIGGLLGVEAVARATDPRALHVAYGLLRPSGAWRAAGPTLRGALLDVLAAGGDARVEGTSVAEPVAVGRRLAWFPRPVGPAHAVAVPGHEATSLAEVPTVRTWLATGSLRAEALQALGRVSAAGPVGRRLRSRAERPVRGSTAELRWAVVAEVRDGDRDVVRAWANGTDPVAATGAVLAAAARTARGCGTRPTSIVDLAGDHELLDLLADLGALRWSVARPVPAVR